MGGAAVRVVVDLTTCVDHGQCVIAAPTVFSLDENGRLVFRREMTEIYVSDELDESLRNEVEEAADACPVQAIEIEDSGP